MKRKTEKITERIQVVPDSILSFFEIQEKNYSNALKEKFSGKTRVKTIRKNGLFNAAKIAGVVWLFVPFISIATKSTGGFAAGTGLCLILLIVIYIFQPVYCPRCKTEMKKIYSENEKVKWCECSRCNVYSNVRRESGE